MTTIQRGHFNGMPCLWLSNGQVRLAVTTDRGPRVLFWGWEGGENLLAELPDLVVSTPAGPYHFLGGHRLWHAPESLARTYWPDDWEIEVEVAAGGARFTTPPDGIGIVKTLHLALADHRPEASVSHTMRNAGSGTLELAPWAITMCRLGGIVLLPQPQALADPDGLLPNRRFTVWPYTDLTDPRLQLGNQIVLVRAQPAPRFKVGYRNHHGWLAYWYGGTLFSKHFDPRLEADHPDFGCNAESYTNERFVEIESLGPLVRLEPGAEVEHLETWRLHAGVPPVTTEREAIAAVRELGLPAGSE